MTNHSMSCNEPHWTLLLCLLRGCALRSKFLLGLLKESLSMFPASAGDWRFSLIMFEIYNDLDDFSLNKVKTRGLSFQELLPAAGSQPSDQHYLFNPIPRTCSWSRSGVIAGSTCKCIKRMLEAKFQPFHYLSLMMSAMCIAPKKKTGPSHALSTCAARLVDWGLPPSGALDMAISTEKTQRYAASTGYGKENHRETIGKCWFNGI